MVDKNTEKKVGLQFARMIVEVKVGDQLPEEIYFMNENGEVIEQMVTYDWKPTMCELCQKYVHPGDRCRRNKERKNEVGEATKGDEKLMIVPVGNTIQLEGTSRGVNEPDQRPNPAKHVQEMARNRRYQGSGLAQPLKTENENGAQDAITCKVKHILLKLEFVASFVYAYNQKEERKALWEYLNQVSMGMNQPWIVLGDFNSVLHVGERQGGKHVTIVEVLDFQACLDMNGLVELPNGGALIHGMINKRMVGCSLGLIGYLLMGIGWTNMVDCRARFLPGGVSDHNPVQVTTMQHTCRRKKAFKYCIVWSTHPQFIEIVEEGWK
ncbi:uncharacterized protein LOC142166232 [Nicotiana tabacum]|uniref:Uncharacterized protein LOC142166232 n=1 Tax=Nicotiana tabacum TaxID=4097 RepID=A0AC58S7P0_TOBAC